MKGYDVIEALGEAADEYVEEAEQRRELKGADTGCRLNRAAGRKEKHGLGSHRGHTWVLKAAAVCALLLVLPAASVLAVDYFSTLKGDELAFGRVEYRGNGIVAIQVRNNSDKVLEFQEDVKLGIFYANEEIPQTEGGSVKMEGNVIAPHSSSELIVDLSGAYDMEIANRPLTDDWYYLVLTNDHFVFGQDWRCMVDFQNVTEEWVIYRTENEEEESQRAGEYREVPEMYLAADLLKERLGDSGTDGVSSGLMVPMFIAFNGAVYSGYDYDVSGDYLIVSDRLVEFSPSYTYTAYQVVGRPDLVAIIINGGYAVYQKVSDVVFSIGGVTYQVECPANYLGEGATGELLSEKNGMKIYQALENQEVIEGKCIVDISKLMSEIFPHLFSNPEKNYSDCRWVAAVVE